MKTVIAVAAFLSGQALAIVRTPKADALLTACQLGAKSGTVADANVLVADTDPFTPFLLELCLRSQGFMMIRVRSAEEADHVAQEVPLRGAFVAERFGGTEGSGSAMAAHLHEDFHLPVVIVGNRLFPASRFEGLPVLPLPLDTGEVLRMTKHFSGASQN